MTATDDTADADLIAGRYRLISKAGSGGMGVVWLARDEVLGRDVAVKELQRDTRAMSGSEVEESHLRIRREARIAARLQHPNAVVVYDVAEHAGRPYLIMEFVPSSSLADILALGTLLAPAEAARIGAQTASALAAAHDAGIVHRDLKPGNILVTDDGTAKLTDFGISRASGDVTVTATGELLGTPAFTAPEVARGQLAGFPSDVFSLGATLYAAVEGTPPFGTDEDAMAVLLRIVAGEIRPPKRTGQLTDTLMWMLRHEPADRPTMKEARQALQAVAEAGMPTVLMPTSLIPDATTPTALIPDVPLGPTAAAASIAAAASNEAAATEAAPDTTGASEPATVVPTPTSAAAELAGATADPPPPAAPEPILPPAKRKPEIRVLAAGLAALVVLLAVVLGIIAATRGGGGTPAAKSSSTSPISTTRSAPTTPAKSASPTPSHSQPSAPAAGAPATTPAAPTPTSQPPTSTPTPTSTSTTPGAPSDVATQLTSTITGYYALIPGNLTQAWGTMTTDYQQNHAKGFSNYQAFWQPIQSVALSDVVANLPATVVATIDYHYSDGHTVEERTSFGMVQVDGAWKIASSSVLSSRTL